MFFFYFNPAKPKTKNGKRKIPEKHASEPIGKKPKEKTAFDIGYLPIPSSSSNENRNEYEELEYLNEEQNQNENENDDENDDENDESTDDESSTESEQ